MYLSDLDIQEFYMEQYGPFLCVDGEPVYRITYAPPTLPGFEVREITDVEIEAWKRGEYKR